MVRRTGVARRHGRRRVTAPAAERMAERGASACLLEGDVGRARRVLDVVDTHTCGQPTRVILAGIPPLGPVGASTARAILAHDYDWVRRLAVLEPRGHRSMMGVAVLPSYGDSDAVLVFMDVSHYPDMCGHATIGAVTALADLGLIEDGKVVRLDTPGGRIEAEVRIRAGGERAIAFRGQTSYVLQTLQLAAPHGKRADVHVAYGGQWYLVADASDFGLRVEAGEIERLIGAASDLRMAASEAIDAVDEVSGVVPRVGNVVWVDAARKPGADSRNIAISEAGAFDRSPCGTATCARLAVLHRLGRKGVGDVFVNESILGTRYRSRIVEERMAGSIPAIVAEVAGSAWLTQRGFLLTDAEDPLKGGFLV